MSAIASAPAIGRSRQAERIAWLRLLWVAPLTVVGSVLVCLGLRALAVLIDPNLARMGQLGPVMTTLAVAPRRLVAHRQARKQAPRPRASCRACRSSRSCY